MGDDSRGRSYYSDNRGRSDNSDNRGRVDNHFVNDGPGVCCWEGCGSSTCKASPDWCGKSRGNCETDCSGEFCPAEYNRLWDSQMAGLQAHLASPTFVASVGVVVMVMMVFGAFARGTRAYAQHSMCPSFSEEQVLLPVQSEARFFLVSSNCLSRVAAEVL